VPLRSDSETPGRARSLPGGRRQGEIFCDELSLLCVGVPDEGWGAVC
jgi:hypothetical protein